MTSMLLRLPVSVRRWRQIPSAVNGSADAIRAIVNFLTTPICIPCDSGRGPLRLYSTVATTSFGAVQHLPQCRTPCSVQRKRQQR